MAMRPNFFNMLLILGLITAFIQPAGAAPVQPINFKGIYEFSFGGMVIGRMGFEVEQTDKNYAITADIVTGGILKLFVKHSSHTTVDGTGAHFDYPNREYESNYQTRKKKKYVKMVMRDGVVEDTRIPPDSNRPPVSAELKNSAYDPLSLMLVIIKSLQEGKRAFKVNAYDGRRLTEATFFIKGERNIPYGNTPLDVIQVNAKRKLVAGFTPSELDSFNPNEAGVQMFFPKGPFGLPVRLEAPIAFGTVAATLIKICRGGESCLLGIK